MTHRICNFLIVALMFSCHSEPRFETNFIRNNINASSIRGMSISDNLIWLGGSKGFVGFIKDDSLFNVSPKGYEKFDFRSVYALSDNEVIVLNAGSPAVVLKTENAGKSWTQKYIDTSALAFYNAIQFFDKKEGIAIGDPVDGRFSILKTFDGGHSWFLAKRRFIRKPFGI